MIREEKNLLRLGFVLLRAGLPGASSKRIYETTASVLRAPVQFHSGRFQVEETQTMIGSRVYRSREYEPFFPRGTDGSPALSIRLLEDLRPVLAEYVSTEQEYVQVFDEFEVIATATTIFESGNKD